MGMAISAAEIAILAVSLPKGVNQLVNWRGPTCESHLPKVVNCHSHLPKSCESMAKSEHVNWQSWGRFHTVSWFTVRVSNAINSWQFA